MPPFAPSYGPYFSLNSPTIRRKIVLSDEKMVDLKSLSYWCRVPKSTEIPAISPDNTTGSQPDTALHPSTDSRSRLDNNSLEYRL